ncbi:YkvA family protein [Anaerovoracaceae bacterium 42-11]|nr:YkvA family protein [Emergencia sp.]
MQFITIRVLMRRIAAITSLLKDKTVPLRKKALVIFGIVYLITPIDIIPAVLFPFALLDDLVLWIYILWTLKDELDVYWMGEKTEDLSKKFRDKTIVEGVEFDVEDKE